MAGGSHDGGRPGGNPLGGMGADFASLMPFLAQFGVLSRMSSGSSTADLFIALALPMLLSQLGVLLQALFLFVSRNLSLAQGMHERRISHQLTTSYWMTFTGHNDDDNDAERAPNSVLHRALLAYINHAFADKALTWQTAEVSTRKLIKPGDASSAGGAGGGRNGRRSNHRGRGDDSDDEEDCEAPQYSYLVQPPDNQFVRLTPHIELKREVEVRDSEGGQAGGRGGVQREHTVTFVLRARTAQRIDAFLRQAVQFYNDRLRSNVDKARYMFVPLLGAAAAGPVGVGAAAGGEGGKNARAMTYRRYRLGEQRTFASFFHPDKDAILDLVRAFSDKSGRYSIAGFPQKLGFLLHGPPGTGKTSFIKALAHLTGRHVVSIPLSRIRTNAELMDMMHEQRVLLAGDEDTSPLPTSRVIFVLEDVDAASTVVRRRSPPPTTNSNNGTPAAAASPAAAAGVTLTATPQPDTPSPGSPPNGEQVLSLSPSVVTQQQADGAGGNSDQTAVDGAIKPASRQLSTEPSPLEVQLLMTQLQLRQVCEAMGGAAAASAGMGQGAAGIEMLASGSACGGGGVAGNVVGPAVPWAPGGGKGGSGGKPSWYKGLLGMAHGDSDDELNLAGLLNVLDGVVDTPDRIIVMTTNHPEMLDPALIRPGRINRKVYMGNLRLREAAQMVAHYYAEELRGATEQEVQARLAAAAQGRWADGAMSPAELECLCAEHEQLGGLEGALGAWFAQHQGAGAAAKA